jgi:hypothetical protein
VAVAVVTAKVHRHTPPLQTEDQAVAGQAGTPQQQDHRLVSMAWVVAVVQGAANVVRLELS